MRLGIVGVRGLVGNTLLRVLEERRFPVSELIAAGSSPGTIPWKNEEIPIVTMKQLAERTPEMVFICAGTDISREWAWQLVKMGSIVIDNSSTWRLDERVPLVVPQVNPHALKNHRGLIANPNCSTIQLATVVAPLYRRFGLERVLVSTYQSVSGSGREALAQLDEELAGKTTPTRYYPFPIAGNLIPQCDQFDHLHYTREEWKIINETRKILEAPHLAISATAVRVPVRVGHCESVWVQLSIKARREEILNTLKEAAGIHLLPDHSYPMPLFVEGKDEVFVGRVRHDPTHPRAWWLWCVADNLRRGAATNAIEIAELLIRGV